MDVRKVAALARLHIEDSQVEAYTRDMKAIVQMVAGLPPVDADGAPDAGAHMALREDAVAPSLPREALLQNAPAADGEYFIVPKVLEDGPEG